MMKVPECIDRYVAFLSCPTLALTLVLSLSLYPLPDSLSLPIIRILITYSPSYSSSSPYLTHYYYRRNRYSLWWNDIRVQLALRRYARDCPVGPLAAELCRAEVEGSATMQFPVLSRLHP